MLTPVDPGSEAVQGWIDGGVGVIRFNRPERSNALHPKTYDAIPQLIEAYTAADEVGCILITAAGRSFCAGGDVQAGVERSRRIAKGEEPPEPESSMDGSLLAHQARTVVMLHGSPKISIAALPGPAVGAGVGIALAADLRIAGTSGAIITGWGKLAYSGDFGGTWFLRRLLGHARALEVLLSGSKIDAERGRSLGLFNRVVPDEDLETEALAWAKEIAAGPTTTFGLMKQNILDAASMTLAEALPGESRRMRESGQSQEHRDAVRSWVAAAKAKRSS